MINIWMWLIALFAAVSATVFTGCGNELVVDSCASEFGETLEQILKARNSAVIAKENVIVHDPPTGLLNSAGRREWGQSKFYRDDFYYRTPRLFHLDNMDECLLKPDGKYCMGTFDIIPQGKNQLYEELKDVSRDVLYRFNQTQVHRGYCISARCPHTRGTMSARFQDCVKENLMEQYGFSAKLTKLNYCKTGDKDINPPIDTLDLAVAGVVLLILILNFIGTVYDLRRDPKNKPNKFLLPWSLRYSWNRLTAVHEGDDRIKALLPSHGVKSILAILVMLAHSPLAVFQPYISDVRDIYRITENPATLVVLNGTLVVQTFISLAAFLFSYNVLVQSEKNKETLSLKKFPTLLLNRYIRLTPVIMLTVGLTATWWVHIAKGPQWSLIVENMRNVCRDKWWTHLLYVNNMVKPDDKCLVQSWFMAVDMQMYVVVIFLVLMLGKRPRATLPHLGFLYIVSVAINFTINYHFSYIPVVQVSTPDNVRIFYAGSDSFNWMYMAPWTSLPAAIAGVISAFLHYSLQQTGVKPADYKWVRLMYRATLPACLLWIATGYLIQPATDTFLLAWYATFDRVIFNLIINVAIFGYFNQIDSIIWKFLSWPCWQILGRMTLSVTMIHWFFSSTIVAINNELFEVGFYAIFNIWVLTVVCALVTAVPLYLCVEVPIYKMLT
ncbi:nose resistant to fluoxetine protein 6-like [Aphomia sociella]